MGGGASGPSRAHARRAQLRRSCRLRARPRRGAGGLTAPAGARFVAILIAIGWVAAVIAAWGILALTLNVDPIGETNAGPFLGPAQVVAGGVVVLVALLRTAAGSGPVLAAAAGAAGAYLAMLAVGAVGYAIVEGNAAVAILFVGVHATSAFTITAALLGVPAVALERIVVVRARRRDERDRPFDRPGGSD